ncbi:ribonuclease HI [Bacillus sp. OV322]|uniref:reverse transcriptase-like protein n=1 Tax=unclassified Bacillus (in: firmicutes) TaxID=185979 RepID=UPI0008E2CE4F|nr:MULTISPECIES: reverse transcriptase-like protein [unclassified Bacillus (in: firmicutes)]OIK07431.1 hypothetical protein BIV59_20910 [Bacillus sp. MUM 13]SFC46544.1 ribonuclease HI [Bacillus sp. OV322]
MKVIMQWTYGAAKKPSATFTSDWVDAKQALIIAMDLEKSGRLKHIEFQDEIGTVWTRKELTKLLEETAAEPQDATVYFDGGFQKENGLSGIGVVIYYTQGKKEMRLRSNRLFHELQSNNEAESAALMEAVNMLEELGVHHQKCTIKGDSQVVINQLKGEWPCFDDVIGKWFDRIEDKLNKLGIKPEYEHIPRKENHEADKLATLALKGESISSRLAL